MGIRFYCPNGHRLNVKDFLAGKRGICPHCEARFRIPRESEIPKGSPKVKPGSAAETSTGNGKRRAKGGTALKAPGREKSTATVRPKPDRKPQPQPAPRDPIDEAPDAVWYVRPPSGGQYGPAKGEVLRRWIAEGRVSADSLVWREGWPDWQLAGPVFPNLGGAYPSVTPLAQATAASLPLQTSSDQLEQPPSGSALSPAVRRKGGKKKSIATVIALLVLIVALFIGLVTVLVMKS
jgi:hypothetical protein